MSGKYVGIIGGSGLYAMEGVKIHEEKRIDTPFGQPSDAFMLGELNGVPVAFLPRHGRGHAISPSEINYRANIYGFRSLGVRHLFSVSAVGSMKEEIGMGDIVIVDQFIDRTRGRPYTFYEKGIVAHFSFANPVSNYLFNIACKAAKKVEVKTHEGGTYICIEGPMFSSRAESKLFRSWGVDVIGMTNYQEARLAKEAGVGYVTIALSTDYDCWYEEEEPVSNEMVLATVKKNVINAQKILSLAVGMVDLNEVSNFGAELKSSVMTSPDKITKEVKARLEAIIGDYF